MERIQRQEQFDLWTCISSFGRRCKMDNLSAQQKWIDLWKTTITIVMQLYGMYLYVFYITLLLFLFTQVSTCKSVNVIIAISMNISNGILNLYMKHPKMIDNLSNQDLVTFWISIIFSNKYKKKIDIELEKYWTQHCLFRLTRF